MAFRNESKDATSSTSKQIPADRPNDDVRVVWHKSTLFNITILGLANFAAPGIWGAMMSLGAGGAESPKLVNAATALTFVLMVVSCFFSPVLVHYVGIKGALIFGTVSQPLQRCVRTW